MRRHLPDAALESVFAQVASRVDLPEDEPMKAPTIRGLPAESRHAGTDKRCPDRSRSMQLGLRLVTTDAHFGRIPPVVAELHRTRSPGRQGLADRTRIR